LPLEEIGRLATLSTVRHSRKDLTAKTKAADKPSHAAGKTAGVVLQNGKRQVVAGEIKLRRSTQWPP
jgi:hypothetical protein